MFDLSALHNVVDLATADGEPAVLTTTTTDWVLGGSLLAEQPLEGYLYDAERPRFCLSNRRNGVTVERSAGSETHRPGWRYAGLALLTDCRILFAIGQADGDVALSAPYADVERVEVTGRLVGETLVVETGAETYRFPCWGDLDPVAAEARRVSAVWSRADEHLDRARRGLEQLDGHLAESSAAEASDVLSLLSTVETELGEARKAIEPLPGGVAAVASEIDSLENEVASMRRRAHAVGGESLLERATDQWDDGAYEAAFDDLAAAAAAFEDALAHDGDDPPDDTLIERRENARAERDRLAQAPRESASFAREMAVAAEEPAEAIRWWETALERYETVYTLDWGPGECRFDVDRDAARDALVDVVGNLIDAYCVAARDHLDGGEEYHYSDPRSVSHDRAGELLEKARALARERLPAKLPDVAAVRAEIDADGASGVPSESTGESSADGVDRDADA